jgi:hypothetical protein
MSNQPIIFDREIYQIFLNDKKLKITTKFKTFKKNIIHCGERLTISCQIKKGKKYYLFCDACATLGWGKEGATNV